MDIPYEKLNKDTLRNIIESYILREGTDYGDQTFSLDEKVGHVMNHLKTRRAKITFDPDSETCNIIAED